MTRYTVEHRDDGPHEWVILDGNDIELSHPQGRWVAQSGHQEDAGKIASLLNEDDFRNKSLPSQEITFHSEIVERTGECEHTSIFTARVVAKSTLYGKSYNVGVAHVGTPCTTEESAHWTATQEFMDRLQKVLRETQ